MKSLDGKKVVFTGFRDDELGIRITARGGRVVASMSGLTDILVASGSKGVQSAKAQRARKQGIRVMSRDDFVAEFLPPSLWDRLVRGADIEEKTEHVYLTHDNGGRAFKVCFNGRRFWVFKPDSRGGDDTVHTVMAIAPTAYKRVFIGHSPRNAMTEFSGGYGPRFDGNSMLFELATGRYMFVGDCVRTFSTTSPITTFVSPVGNSDVPYPFAVDASGVVYLLSEEVRLTAGPYPREVLLDPYELYYSGTSLTPDMARHGSATAEVVPFEGITKFYIGNRPYTCMYRPRPAQDFDRISQFGRDTTRHVPVHVVAYGKKILLNKQEYVSLMRRVGKQRGFAPLQTKLLHPRVV